MSKIAKFFSILTAELVDAKDEFEESIRAVEEARAREACTEYVRRQNEALYRSEVSALRDLARDISLRDTSAYASLDEAVSAVTALVGEKTKRGNYPELMKDFLGKKIEKVRRFVEDQK